jgi:16S rRNA (guanine527-N7)-methyltransferase
MDERRVAQLIEDGVAKLGQDLPAGANDKLLRLAVGLERWNARINLTAIRDAQGMVSGHILDSLAVRPCLRGARAIDVGTGAGFPGLPLAIAEPGVGFELLDSNARKLAFVTHMIGELGLENVTVVKARAEHYEPGTPFDTVFARAFAAIPEIIELAGRLVSDNGVLLALKGKYPHDELRQLMDRNGLSDLWDYEVTELTVPGLESHARHVVVLRRRQAAAR